MEVQFLGASTSTNTTLTIMPKQNTNYIDGWGSIFTYIDGWGSIFTRKHPSLNYGQTGKYWTDASSPKGHAWFAASVDDGFAKPAVAVKLSYIFTKDSTYVDGTEA